MARRNYKQRRGLSSVVGAVFMILVMIGALNLVIWTLQQQDRVTQTVIEKTNQNLNKINEDIQISDLRVSGGKLNLTASNSGGATATIKSIYVVNETASPKEQYTYDLDIPVDGRETVSDIGQNLPAIGLEDEKEYTVKIVTESGNAATAKIIPISSAALPMTLTVIPPTIPPGQNVTLLFTVTNNITDSTLAWPVDPVIEHDCVSPCVLTPSGSDPAPALISQGSTALFKWTYKVESGTPDGTQITFNASLTNAKPGNFVEEVGLVKIIETSETTIIVNEELISKPELFLIVPGPYGDSSDEALVGVVVVNPTDQPMDVNRIWIAAYTSIQGGNQVFFDSGPGNSCSGAQYIYPTTNWSCPHDNLIMWVNTAVPVTIPGYGVESFLTRQEPGSLNQGAEPGFNINFGVYSSLGQFAKTGISSTMDSASQPLANVYLTDIIDPLQISQVVQNNHMKGHKLALPENSVQTFSIAFSDLDTVAGTKVKSGTKLIINVPPGFDLVTPVCALSVGFTCTYPGPEPQIRPYSDDSTQIIATINSDLGDQASEEAKMLVFTAETPDVTGTKVYIMHVLADGETNSATPWSVSPLAQIALQIVG